MYRLYNLSHNLSWLVIILFLLAISGLVKRNSYDELIKTKNRVTKKIIVGIAGVLEIVLLLFQSSEFMYQIGSKDIRALPVGTYCFYVNATNEDGNTYTLPAKVHKTSDSFKERNSAYYVENVYFKDGGYLYFEDGDIQYPVYDQNNAKWKIGLTNKKAYYSKVTEQVSMTNESISNIVFISIATFIVFLSTILYLTSKVK